MSVYRVESGGRAPAGLSTGDEVVTGGGTYRITGVNADGSYQSQLVNKNQTTRNYGGSYQTRNSPYTMSGVSDYTRSKLNGLESGYTPSGSVQAAQAYLEQVKASKPGAYQSRWDDELTSLYDQIRNRKKFSYDMGTDPLYQQYREQYQRLGRLAMQDTMGQAAALTGGYGSTYGEQVGQQAYNAYLQNLNDIVPQLQQQAYQRYQDEGTDLYNQYSLVKGREDTDYGRYRDTVSDYYSDLSDARSAYNSERSLEQSQWATTGRRRQTTRTPPTCRRWRRSRLRRRNPAAEAAVGEAVPAKPERGTSTTRTTKAARAVRRRRPTTSSNAA